MKTENNINTYGYCVIKSAAGFPLHVVGISHCMLSAYAVFSTAAAARDYIIHEKARCDQYGTLLYNPDFDFSGNLTRLYRSASAGLFTDLRNKQIYINNGLATNFDYCAKWADYMLTITR